MSQRHEPRLCIGVPVYNGENFLAQAIESLLAQTFSDFRLVISDNGSTDGTQDICQSFARRDSRITIHRSEKNRGLVWNFNRLPRFAGGAYFKWAAHDDVCAPEFLRRCVEVLDREPNVILSYTRAEVIDERGERIGEREDRVDATAPAPFERFRNLLANLLSCHMVFGVVRLAVLRQTPLFGRHAGSDTILLAELALRGRFHAVDEPLFQCRDHADQADRAHPSEHELAAWFDPARPHRLPLAWTQFFQYLRAVARVPIPLDQKLRCASLILRRPVRYFARRWRPSLAKT